MLTTLLAAVLLFAVVAISNALTLLAIAILLRVPNRGLASSAVIAAIIPCAQILTLTGLYFTYELDLVIVVALGSIIALVYR